jgi:RNA polymerase sigma-70 factor (ECF subfamily)
MKSSVLSTFSLLCARTDEEAMCRVKRHDDHSEFARLMKRWEEPIRRLCTRLVGDAHRGEDLKQDTFLRLFEKRKAYEPTGKFSTFLWRIALNLCYDEIRRLQRRREFLREPEEQQPETDEAASDGPGPDARTAQLEEGELVRDALLQLPEIYRTVLVLRHYENLKLTRIAEILEIPEGTVNSRMAEALSRLSRLLEPKLRSNPLSHERLKVLPRDSTSAPGRPNRSNAPEQSLLTVHKFPNTNYQVLNYEPSNT